MIDMIKYNSDGFLSERSAHFFISNSEKLGFQTKIDYKRSWKQYEDWQNEQRISIRFPVKSFHLLNCLKFYKKEGLKYGVVNRIKNAVAKVHSEMKYANPANDEPIIDFMKKFKEEEDILKSKNKEEFTNSENPIDVLIDELKVYMGLFQETLNKFEKERENKDV